MAILKIYYSTFLQNCSLYWAEIWCGASGQLVDLKLYKSCQFDIQYGGHRGHLENLFFTFSAKLLVILSWNYGASGQLVRLKLYKLCRFHIQSGCHGGHLENLFLTLLLQNHFLYWAEIWFRASEQLIDLMLYKLCWFSIQNGHMEAILKNYFQLFLQNCLLYWAEILCWASG